MSAYCRFTAELLPTSNGTVSKEVRENFYEIMSNNTMDNDMCDKEDYKADGYFSGNCNTSVCRYKENSKLLNFAKENNVSIELTGFCEERWWESYLMITPDGVSEESEGYTTDSEKIEDSLRWELDNVESLEDVEELRDEIDSMDTDEDTKETYIEVLEELLETEYSDLPETSDF